MAKSARKIAVLTAFLLVTAAQAAMAAPEFYTNLLRRGIGEFNAGRYATASTLLRTAAFGLLDVIDQYETAQTYSALAAQRLGREEDARHATRRILAAERVQRRFASLPFPPEIRAEFDTLAKRFLTGAEQAALTDSNAALPSRAPATEVRRQQYPQPGMTPDARPASPTRTADATTIPPATARREDPKTAAPTRSAPKAEPAPPADEPENLVKEVPVPAAKPPEVVASPEPAVRAGAQPAPTTTAPTTAKTTTAPVKPDAAPASTAPTTSAPAPAQTPTTEKAPVVPPATVPAASQAPVEKPVVAPETRPPAATATKPPASEPKQDIAKPAEQKPAAATPQREVSPTQPATAPPAAVKPEPQPRTPAEKPVAAPETRPPAATGTKPPASEPKQDIAKPAEQKPAAATPQREVSPTQPATIPPAAVKPEPQPRTPTETASPAVPSSPATAEPRAAETQKPQAPAAAPKSDVPLVKAPAADAIRDAQREFERKVAEVERAEPKAAPKAQPVHDASKAIQQAATALDRGDIAGARTQLRAILAVKELKRADLVRVAEESYRARDFALAVEAFDRAGGIQRGEEALGYYLAVSLYETGRYREAKVALRNALPFIELTEDVARYQAKIEGAID